MNDSLNISPNAAALKVTASQTRLLAAMQTGLSRSGYHGTSTAMLLKSAQTPKGVMYHHYPKGKEQLAILAITAARKEVTTSLKTRFTTNPDICKVLAMWFNTSLTRLQAEQFQSGCAFAAVALDLEFNDHALRQSLNQAFTAINACIAQALSDQGMSASVAGAWACLLICTYEGALIQARVSQDLVLAQASVSLLLELLRKELTT
jgi:TetR/AcrR family transcriptional regulator, lmrAB and yxaGH operons repressor